MSLLEESVEKVVTLTADTAAERPNLPLPETPCGDLLLADRGYSDLGYLRTVDRSEGSLVVRTSASLQSDSRETSMNTGSKHQSATVRNSGLLRPPPPYASVFSIPGSTTRRPRRRRMENDAPLPEDGPGARDEVAAPGAPAEEAGRVLPAEMVRAGRNGTGDGRAA